MLTPNETIVHDYIEAHPGKTAREITTATGLGYTSVLRVLYSLRECGYVRDPYLYEVIGEPPDDLSISAASVLRVLADGPAKMAALMERTRLSRCALGEATKRLREAGTICSPHGTFLRGSR